MENKCRVGRID